MRQQMKKALSNDLSGGREGFVIAMIGLRDERFKDIFFLLILGLGLLGRVEAQPKLNDFEAVLPQISRGAAGSISVETVVTLVNPWGEEVMGELLSTNEELFASSSVTLEPFERREIVIQGGDLKIGAVRFRATRKISISARRTTFDGGIAVSTATIPGVPASNAVAFPVFSESPEFGSTGIALYFQELDLFDFTLSMTRRVVKSRRERYS
jgi:hypothetical protein